MGKTYTYFCACFAMLGSFMFGIGACSFCYSLCNLANRYVIIRQRRHHDIDLPAPLANILPSSRRWLVRRGNILLCRRRSSGMYNCRNDCGSDRSQKNDPYCFVRLESFYAWNVGDMKCQSLIGSSQCDCTCRDGYSGRIRRRGNVHCRPYPCWHCDWHALLHCPNLSVGDCSACHSRLDCWTSFSWDVHWIYCVVLYCVFTYTPSQPFTPQLLIEPRALGHTGFKTTGSGVFH
jgi:hypothetical protein